MEDLPPQIDRVASVRDVFLLLKIDFRKKKRERARRRRTRTDLDISQRL